MVIRDIIVFYFEITHPCIPCLRPYLQTFMYQKNKISGCEISLDYSHLISKIESRNNLISFTNLFLSVCM